MHHRLTVVWLIVLATLLGACTQDDFAAGPDSDTSTDLSTQATWPVVQQGAQGQTVTTIQYLLRHRSYDVAVDGDFGPGTDTAVRNFQSASGLTSDGIVGTNTWNTLVTTVRQGSTGDPVRAVQSELGISVDGVFGSGTDGSVRTFQSANGLTADGIVGPDTWAALVGGGGNPGGEDRASLARSILGNGNIDLWPYSPVSSGSSDGADARSNIEDTAAGGAAQRSAYENAPGGSVYLDTRMLQGLLSVANTYSVRVTSIVGGSHSVNSRHYSGIAFDIDRINGQGVSSSNPYYSNLESLCRSAGATEVLGPGDAGHSAHVHCAWPR